MTMTSVRDSDVRSQDMSQDTFSLQGNLSDNEASVHLRLRISSRPIGVLWGRRHFMRGASQRDIRRT